MHRNATGTGPLIDLDEWDRLMIIAGAAVFLLLVMVFLICALNPDCCLYRYCPFEYQEGEKTHLQPVYGSLYDPTIIPDKRGQNVKGHRWHPLSPLREAEMTDWSDISVPEIIEMKQDTSGRSRKWSRTSDYSSSASTYASPVPPDSRLSFGLIFDPARGKLQVTVIQIGNFRVTEPEGVLAPYVRVSVYRILKHFFAFKTKTPKEFSRSQLVMEVQTKIQRRTDNPVFNESFSFDVEGSDITGYVIKFVVCDFDKFSRHTIIGEVICDLSKVQLPPGEEVIFNEVLMEPQEEDLGQLHVALMYLPTAEKLSVTVMSAKDLWSSEGPKRNTEVYVKITLMYDGRPVRKTKTLAKGSEVEPVFNETFVFDVPAYQLDKVYFIFAVIEAEKDRQSSRHLLGRLYIGVNFDDSAKAQWLEMVQNARKQVACWHRLQN